MGMKQKAHLKKQITLDSLAGMVQRGFIDIDKKFDGVAKRFDDVGKRFDDVDKQFDAVGKRFDQLEERFDNLEKIILHDHHDRIARLEDQVKELQTDFRALLGMKR